ncbi:MAG: kelch repeat-containing protein, partial [Flavisolibacter sp.]
GNMWLFGGDAGNGLTVYNFYNDLWKFDPSSNEWTWMKGSNTVNQMGNYGTQGISSPSNTPGARQFSSAWKDASGNFWVFGGNGMGTTTGRGALNDLWKYSVANNEWTWVKGKSTTNQKGVYGTIGVAASANMPGARANACTWTDKNGNFWLYGGNGMSASSFGSLNDLWKYDPVANEWTWMNGSNTTSQLAVYGTKGISSPLNTPGGRSSAASWTDTNGNLWLFGGMQGFGSGFLNDLWKYDPVTSQWTWMSGSNSNSNPGSYGIAGIASSSNVPGSRIGMTGWTDATGVLWMFGGDGYDANSTVGYLNDIWKFDPISNQWTWMKGSNTVNQNGSYSTIGLANVTNAPAARSYAVVWNSNGNNWIFGGTKSGTYLNDLWSIPIVVILPVKLESFTAQIENKQVKLNWTTAQEENSWEFIIERSANGKDFSPVGTVSASGNSSIQVYYEYYDREPLAGNNYYRLKQIDKDGSFEYSRVILVSKHNEKVQVILKQNPILSELNANIVSVINQKAIITVFNTNGQQLLKTEKDLVIGSNSFSVQCSSWNKGIFIFTIHTNDLTTSIQVVK